MAKFAFEVRPVQSYQAPYPGGPAVGAVPPPEDGEDKPHPLTVLLLAILTVGLFLGLVGCYLNYEVVGEPPVPQTTGDGGGDGGDAGGGDGGDAGGGDGGDAGGGDGGDAGGGDGGAGDGTVGDAGGDADSAPPQGCSADLPACRDGRFEHCEDGQVVSLDCSEHCRQEFGPQGVSGGCDVEAADPCLCSEYGIPAGVPPVCDPSELVCLDEWTLRRCDGLNTIEQSCHDYCEETHGLFWSSRGCVETAEDPCQCEYGLVDGDPVPYCSPEELATCVNPTTVSFCNDHSGFDIKSCDDFCRENYGPHFESTGCDETQEDNICGCYGIVDGGVPAL